MSFNDNQPQPQEAEEEEEGRSTTSSILNDYFQMLRPVTILQAVGALVVGRLAVLSSSSPSLLFPQQLLLTSLSVFLSYGCGMAINDVTDATMDAQHTNKSNRPIASGRIPRTRGWLYCILLSILSISLADWASTTTKPSASIPLRLSFPPPPLVLWTLSNLAIMFGYALYFQKVFLVKNLLCGWLAISPLVGANLLESTASAAAASTAATTTTALTAGINNSNNKLHLLALAGFPLQVAREILKDAEDVEVDRGNKQTLPLVLGVETSRKLAYALVFLDIGGMILTPFYWKMFATTNIPIYPMSVCAGFGMCYRASRLSLGAGQSLLKKSIYVMLAGMIGALLLQ